MSSAGGVAGHLPALTSPAGISGCFCLCIAHVHSPAGQASGSGEACGSTQLREWAVVGTAVTRPAGGWSWCWANGLRGGCVLLHAQWPECHPFRAHVLPGAGRDGGAVAQTRLHGAEASAPLRSLLGQRLSLAPNRGRSGHSGEVLLSQWNGQDSQEPFWVSCGFS